MKTLYLMRHGETLFNRQKRIQGWCDSPLTDAGRAQAQAMGRRLAARGVRIDHAYASTAERTADTLELVLAEIAAAQGDGAVPATYGREKGIREVCYGELEAMPEYLSAPGPEAARTYYLQFGGESTDTVRDRMVDALTDIMCRADHDQVLAVGHGGANFNFLRAIQDPTAELKKGWGNCTLAVYAFDESRAGERPDGAGAGPFRLLEVLRLTDEDPAAK